MDIRSCPRKTSSLLWDALKTASLPILCYDLVLLRPWSVLGGTVSGAATQILFLLIVVGGALAGFWLTPPDRWGGLNTFAAIALPLELYSLPVLFQRSQRLAFLSLAVSAVSLAAFYLLIGRQPPQPRTEDMPRHPKLCHCLYYTRHVLSLSLTLVLVFLVVTLGLDFSSPGGAVGGRAPVGSISDHLQELGDFQEPRWSDLSNREKTTLLQLAADLETSYLGLPVSPQVQMGPMEDRATRGAYTHQTKSILLNQGFVEESTGPQCLETLLHECYHSYQWYLCEAYDEISVPYRDLLVYRSVKNYRDEFSHYVDDGSPDYYYQTCEMEARDYADQRLDFYLDWLTGHGQDENWDADGASSGREAAPPAE